MIKISQWYKGLKEHTFPTMFVKMTPKQKEFFLQLPTVASLQDYKKNPELDTLQKVCQKAIKNFPFSSFVGLDSCSPTDIKDFTNRRSHSTAIKALSFLKESTKVIKALEEGEDTLIFRPYRRMNKTREFRLFIKAGQLVGVSQYCLERHFRRLEGHKQVFFEISKKFIQENKELLPKGDFVMDIYLTRKREILIVDFNTWGEPTQPLLFKWNHQWKEEGEIRLMLPPKSLKGDIKLTY